MTPVVATPTRCAVYTRKSTDEGLDSDFNSLDAQREIAESYIASQRADGWVTLADRYDDGGFTGANTNRPALRNYQPVRSFACRQGRNDLSNAAH